MNNEWRELPTMADVAAAQAAGEEIEMRQSMRDWEPWHEASWQVYIDYRARPAQPKMKKVKVIGWFDTVTGSTYTRLDGAPVSSDAERYPKLDDEIEVPYA